MGGVLVERVPKKVALPHLIKSLIVYLIVDGKNEDATDENPKDKVWTLWAKDRLYYYGSRMYMVTVHGKYTIIWISIFIYIVHRYSVVHIITDSYKIYI